VDLSVYNYEMVYPSTYCFKGLGTQPFEMLPKVFTRVDHFITVNTQKKLLKNGLAYNKSASKFTSSFQYRISMVC